MLVKPLVMLGSYYWDWKVEVDFVGTVVLCLNRWEALVKVQV